MDSLKTVNYTLIAKRLKEMRIQRHLKQKDVAEIMKMTENYISRLESGTVPSFWKTYIHLPPFITALLSIYLRPEVENPDDYLLAAINQLAEQATSKQREQIFKIMQVLLDDNTTH